MSPVDTVFSPHTPVHVSTCSGCCGLCLGQGVNRHSHHHSVISNSNHFITAQIIENGQKMLLPDCLCSFWQHHLTYCSCIPSLIVEKAFWASKVPKIRSPPGNSQAACFKLEPLSCILNNYYIPGLSSVR